MLFKLKEKNNKPNESKILYSQADQLAIYKDDRGVELGSTEKQLQLSGQIGTWSRNLKPLGYAPSSLRYSSPRPGKFPAFFNDSPSSLRTGGFFYQVIDVLKTIQEPQFDTKIAHESSFD